MRLTVSPRVRRTALAGALILVLVSDAVIIAFDFISLYLTGTAPILRGRFAGTAIIPLVIWLTGGTLGVYVFRGLVWSSPCWTRATFIALAIPTTMWARLFLSDCWLPSYPECGPFSSPLILGIALGSAPFLAVLVGFQAWRLATGDLSWSTVLRHSRFLAVLVVAFGLIWASFKVLSLRDSPFNALPSSGNDTLLLLGFESLITLGLLTLMLAIHWYRGGIPVKRLVKTFLRAHQADVRASSHPFLIATTTTVKSSHLLVAQFSLYTVFLVVFMAVFFRVAGFAEASPVLGFATLGLSLLTSATWWLIALIVKRSTWKQLLPSAIFAWLAPAGGAAAWFLSGHLYQFFYMLVAIPIMIWAIYGVIGWIPGSLKKLYQSFKPTLARRGGGRQTVLGQYWWLTRVVMKKLYDPNELRVWQIIVAVGIWGVSWGLPVAARFSGDERVAETASEFTSGFNNAEYTAIAWMMLALFPACRVLTIVGVRDLLGKRSPPPGSVVSMGLTLLVFIALVYLYLSPVSVLIGLTKYMFGESGLKLVVQFYFFPIILPWVNSLLLSGWLLASRPTSVLPATPQGALR